MLLRLIFLRTIQFALCCVFFHGVASAIPAVGAIQTAKPVLQCVPLQPTKVKHRPFLHVLLGFSLPDRFWRRRVTAVIEINTFQ